MCDEGAELVAMHMLFVCPMLTRDPNICLNLHLHLYFMYASTTGAGESAHMTGPLLFNNGMG